ncbi:MAG TPA: NUDIX domain-containing protein [Candidatus Paceibacterota bacterium]|nr:NUDIX domain-containing protein [Candidatus Paceibacterota bacterium]
MSENKFVIRCRAIIIHDEKLLVVSHPHDTSFYALPGGHLEWGENAHECMRREIIEELGVEPEIGRLLYVNTFMDGNTKQPFEFFFEVLNGSDFLDADKRDRTHGHEISDMQWIGADTDIRILPGQLEADLRAGNLLADITRFIAS